MPSPIVVVEYDPDWPERFRLLCDRIGHVLAELVAAIEHIGSTAVPALSAKPVIDIDVLLASESFLSEAIRRLAGLGYRHEGDLGIAGREAFTAPQDEPPHHLYVCLPDRQGFARHLAFRDYLRANPWEAQHYGELKKQLAQRFPDNRSAYAAGKSDVVEKLTSRALRGR